LSSVEAPTAIEERRGFWPAIRESLAGSYRDYTEGEIIILYAVAMD